MREKIKSLTALCLLAMLSLQGCIGGGVSAKRTLSQAGTTDSGQGGSGNSGGNNTTPTDDNDLSDGTTTILKVDVTNMFDPFTGTLKSKVTIPKNYDGPMYISGLNITSLRSNQVYVRFKFGRELTVVDVPAVIGRASGITPQTTIDVVTLDMSSRPFQNVRINKYDLFDYNDYLAGSGLADGERVTSPYDGDLYCRGLLLEHDPTFEGNSITNPTCDAAGETCLYAYAKIEDQTFMFDDVVNGTSTKVSNRPKYPQINVNASKTYANDDFDNIVQKCLPDTNSSSVFNAVLRTNYSGTVAMTDALNPAIVPWATGVNITGDNYYLSGPYKTPGVETEPSSKIEYTDWEIKGDAVFSGKGVFNDTMLTVAGVKKIRGGFDANLYPRFSKVKFNENVNYIGSSDPFSLKSILSVGTSGVTDFMYGCNARTLDYSSLTLESISSCNVTATISLIEKDSSGEVTNTLAENIGLKLQIVRDSNIDFNDNETVYTSLRSCDSNRVCGKDECCFNNKCWSTDIVAQCFDDDDAIGGQLGTGLSCQNDLECASLCCNESTGTCAEHYNEGQANAVLCGKAVGQSCVTSQYCAQVNVNVWKKVKTVLVDGTVSCRLEQFNERRFAECDGTCRQPETPTKPEFDPANPDCEGAIEPPISN
ncbi:putative lipoprotein [Bacteriovorax sp. BSW11_IV]|uniref:hypothetical protein n=1 Tax=Bacteriovorax sp. BSW11_IV TaxID=1353529 RepID=UPI000389FB53|nr:hypothetical protein [Bacteriovorax sp. BSW11_IV]EQC44641.1 putative lipoprotein [Bacteriovorax sp. BSW11_IV]